MPFDVERILGLYVAHVGVTHVPKLCELLPMLHEIHLPPVFIIPDLSVPPLNLVTVQLAPEYLAICFL